MGAEYQRCVRCLMDTTDSDITFDGDGVCSYCHYYDEKIKPNIYRSGESDEFLRRRFEQIIGEGRKKEYDCILGLSGGIDSSYMALKIKDFGLRPLVVHVDAGWNSEVAVNNIRAIIDCCGWELHTIVIDWQEMKDLQVAYLKSGVANQDVPQDHVFFSSLYSYAVRHGVKHVLSGGNYATEAIFPSSWHYTAMDGKNLRTIHGRFGSRKIDHLPIMKLSSYYFYYPMVKGLKVFRPLNFMPYDRNIAENELSKIGFKSYGSKHCESIFTKFFQRHYLPIRYGFDKRIPHLSSMILSGSISREQAMEEYSRPLYDPRELEEDILFIKKKLDLSDEDYRQIMDAPKRNANEFASDEKFYRFVKSVQVWIENRYSVSLKRYS